ncbi:MAG: Peptide chain release factor 1 [Chlamydiales bacterium]|nr:Peptide chain release factor 1 [Chlamydiales bacterium]MCH9635871.1 Peptide chain release factor 1 [Chlamydiales bacterium]MCH9704387.1 peptide chain release factor-like protein [Chlamydiota bacterium]
MVKPEKLEALAKRMEKLQIDDKDLTIKYILGSGSGGQKVNKSHTAVYIKHQPSGIEVKCQKTRSQSLNLYYAKSSLCEKLEEKLLGERSKRQQEAAKIRRQKKRRSRRSKDKMLDSKRLHSEKKQLRRPPD